MSTVAQFLGLGTKNRYHVRPSEKGPFAIYALEVHTPYSKRIIKRSFSEFANLQKIVSYYQFYGIHFYVIIACAIERIKARSQEYEKREIGKICTAEAVSPTLAREGQRIRLFSALEFVNSEQVITDTEAQNVQYSTRAGIILSADLAYS